MSHIWLFVILFLLVGAFFIVSEQNLVLYTQQGFAKFYDSYYLWMAKMFSNAKSITGYMVRFDWLPSNSNSTKGISR
jgi:hypothetical protein